MKKPYSSLSQSFGKKMAVGALLLTAALFLCLGSTGCGAADADQDSTTLPDPFPAPLTHGRLLPLEDIPMYQYSYVELDSAGNIRKREANRELRILRHNGPGRFTYRFTGDAQGLIFIRKDSLKSGDTAGIYLVASSQTDNVGNTIETPWDTVLWIPQNPMNFTSTWSYGPATMEYRPADTVRYVKPLFSHSQDLPISSDGTLQRFSVFTFRETLDKRVTDYHFAPGVGLIAFERFVNGHLAYIGEIHSFSRQPPFSSYY